MNIKNIQEKVQHTLYGYDKDEFLPIFVEGAWVNRTEFRAYKVKKVAEVFGRGIEVMAEYASEKMNRLYEL